MHTNRFSVLADSDDDDDTNDQLARGSKKKINGI